MKVIRSLLSGLFFFGLVSLFQPVFHVVPTFVCSADCRVVIACKLGLKRRQAVVDGVPPVTTVVNSSILLYSIYIISNGLLIAPQIRICFPFL